MSRNPRDVAFRHRETRAKLLSRTENFAYLAKLEEMVPAASRRDELEKRGPVAGHSASGTQNEYLAEKSQAEIPCLWRRSPFSASVKARRSKAMSEHDMPPSGTVTIAVADVVMCAAKGHDIDAGA